MTAKSGCNSESGMSIIEVMILAVVISMLMIVMTESLTTMSSVRMEQKAHFRVGDVADHVARRIQTDVNLAARIFGGNSDDLDYLRSMAIGAALLRSGRRLPSVTQNGFFRPDAEGSVETGNILFLALRGPRVQLQLEGGTARLVQSIQFVIYAPVDDEHHLDLVRWQSQPLVNYFDIIGIKNEVVRADALRQLAENDIQLAWDPYGQRSSALFEIAGSSLQPVTADRLVQGKEDGADSRPFVMRHMQLPTDQSQIGILLPAYARVASGFHGAFEIKVDGSISGKLVLLRFVVASTQPGLKRHVWSEIHRFLPTNG
ncbi:MAG: hypothetical protein WCR59_01870 [Planctomycetota bacterium]|jgi:hypothetical protein